jgi:hypothetical protein
MCQCGKFVSHNQYIGRVILMFSSYLLLNIRNLGRATFQADMQKYAHRRENSELLVHVHLNPRVSTSELKENWNDNLAAVFEATHDGCHVRIC